MATSFLSANNVPPTDVFGVGEAPIKSYNAPSAAHLTLCHPAILLVSILEVLLAGSHQTTKLFLKGKKMIVQ